MEKMSYVKVVGEKNEQPIELLTEPDGSLRLSTLSAQFPGACGLKYLNSDTGNFRGLRIDDAGKILPPNPDGPDRWNEITFIAVFSKGHHQARYCFNQKTAIKFFMDFIFTDYNKDEMGKDKKNN